MQIKNTTQTNFQGIRIQSSKMNKAQLNLCDRFIDNITYTDAYIKSSEENIDLYILPANGNRLKLCFIDKISDMFFLNNGKRSRIKIPIFKQITPKMAKEEIDDSLEHCTKSTENVLNGIMNNSIPRPNYDYQKILESKTDVAKIRPEHYESMFDEVDEIFDIEYIKEEDNRYAPEILEF